MSDEANNLKFVHDLDLGMCGNLDSAFEESSGTKLLLSGPLVDGVVEQIGTMFSQKLSRGRHTGIQSCQVYIHHLVYRQLMKLINNYGAKLDVAYNKKKEPSVITQKIVSMESLRSVFHFSRIRKNCLAKEKFGRILQNGKQVSGRLGSARVVVTPATPVTIQYKKKTSKATITFFVQRYDSQDFALDAELQRKMNEE